MKAILARIIRFLLPEKYWAYIQSVRSRNYQLRWLKQSGLLDLAVRFANAKGSTVLHGPFAGMEYPPESIRGRHSVPMLLGSYECELHELIGAALSTKYQMVVDVGSAEGYYAVGFALKGKLPVVAFDADARELRLCKEMARLNNVEITARTWCSPASLRNLVAGSRCFILSDCEGYETELFDDSTVEALSRSSVLIEIHGEAYDPLVERFSKTHAIQTLVASGRSIADYPELECLGEQAPRALKEYRLEGQRWLYATPRELAP